MIDAVMPTYARTDITFQRGKGAYLYSSDGDEYLDFTTGLATVCLGHSHPVMVDAVARQAGELMHVSNLYRIPEQEKLANRLVAATFGDTVFFCNSGAEANECAIKTARRYHYVNGSPERYRILTFENAFHGRTLGTIAATGSEKVLEGFGPKVEGFDQVPFGDIESVISWIDQSSAAIMLEPIQAEGGVLLPPEGFIRALREVSDDNDILLIVDEVQTGMGRTGRLLAHEWTGVTPDIATLGKGIGGGFPMGACIATQGAAKGMVAGTHGTTFGGNPLAATAGNAVLDVILVDGFLDNVSKVSERLLSRLRDLAKRNDSVIETVRGTGLLVGIKCKKTNIDIVNAMRAKGVLIPPAGDNVVRMLPPLIIGEVEIERAVTALEEVCRDLGE